MLYHPMNTIWSVFSMSVKTFWHLSGLHSICLLPCERDSVGCDLKCILRKQCQNSRSVDCWMKEIKTFREYIDILSHERAYNKKNKKQLIRHWETLVVMSTLFGSWHYSQSDLESHHSFTQKKKKKNTPYMTIFSCTVYSQIWLLHWR